MCNLMNSRRNSITLLALNVLAACAQDGVPASTAKSSEQIFRYVELNMGRVNLAEQLPYDVRAAAAVAPGDTVVPLPRGSFVGAERITLYLTPKGLLKSAVFDYTARIDFEAMLRNYASLGPPTRTQEQRQGEEPSAVVS